MSRWVCLRAALAASAHTADVDLSSPACLGLGAAERATHEHAAETTQSLQCKGPRLCCCSVAVHHNGTSGPMLLLQECLLAEACTIPALHSTTENCSAPPPPHTNNPVAQEPHHPPTHTHTCPSALSTAAGGPSAIEATSPGGSSLPISSTTRGP